LQYSVFSSLQRGTKLLKEFKIFVDFPWKHILLCRLYPTKEHVARRQAEQEEKLKRGERLGENKNRFGRNSVSFNSRGTRGASRGEWHYRSE
jgi:hypothetical protein